MTTDETTEANFDVQPNEVEFFLKLPYRVCLKVWLAKCVTPLVMFLIDMGAGPNIFI